MAVNERPIRCAACGGTDHISRFASCSRVHLAMKMMAETGCSARAAARALDIKHQAVSEAHKRARLGGTIIGGPQIEEHW